MARKKPYTELGLKRIKCARCGAKAKYQWHICSNAEWLGICRECDIGLNRAALEYMKDPDIDKKMHAYALRA